MSEWKTVCNVSDLEGTDRFVTDIDDLHVMIIKDNDDFYAIESMCSHAMFELDDAEIKNCKINCPLHGAFFSIKTGEPLTAPAVEPLVTYPVRVVDGEIQIQEP